ANDCQNQGGGKVLLQALIEETEKLGLWTLVAWIFAKNEPSVRLHKSVGFREVGIHERAGKLDGEWQDMVVLEKRSTKI
ncbi:MAG: N-acetyltransferase, partial [Negativicutes bacterium]|nr:N-acetyltransferase [Negativicutes bacterium]